MTCFLFCFFSGRARRLHRNYSGPLERTSVPSPTSILVTWLTQPASLSPGRVSSPQTLVRHPLLLYIVMCACACEYMRAYLNGNVKYMPYYLFSPFHVWFSPFYLSYHLTTRTSGIFKKSLVRRTRKPGHVKLPVQSCRQNCDVACDSLAC